MNPSDIDLDALLKRLHTPTMRRLYDAFASRAATESWSHRDYLALLVAEEVAHRNDTRIQRAARQARFPFIKTVENFDFLFQSTLKLQRLGPYLGPEFVSEGRNLILSGQPGRGKTHLAVAVGYRAIQNGFSAKFVSASALIDDLGEASRAGRLRDATATWVEPHVLIIDEVGYLNHAADAANVLFGVVDQRYLARKPMVFTTNKKLRDWGHVLHDPDLAEVILDRVLERGQHIALGGRSYRTQHLDPETIASSAASEQTEVWESGKT
ncbi:MAG: Mobile element protein [Myxococcaceae bacterium]|nr:Mobile element protein [Myxococcaceae bacterium]